MSTPMMIIQLIFFSHRGRKKILLNANAKYLFCQKRLNAVCVCRTRESLFLASAQMICIAMEGDARL